MADPRIQRTKDHVLAVARRLLSEPSDVPLTFTTLAAEAQVSRRTLYTHWGSIDRVIAEAATEEFAAEDTDFSGLDLTGRLCAFLRLVRNRLADPATSVAATGLVARAVHDPEAVEVLAAMVERGRGEFALHVAPITPEQYELIIGPLFHAEFFTRRRMTDDQLDAMVPYVVSLLGDERALSA
jgi:AcrR family transcriptional regulator